MNLTFIPFRADHDNKDRCRQISTKATAKRHESHFAKAGGKLFSSGTDKDRAVLSLLESAYGVNIGEQVFERLTEKQLEKIATNCKAAYTGDL